jgi:phosphoribosylaminoimidazolecarboxamide formyltransferase / IMP cyclohydrolase
MTKKALISVYNKNNIVELANHLVENDYNILSTGGTANLLRDNNIPVTNISDYTAYPEILNGRVKTLHPKIYGGLLNVRNNNEHNTQCNDLNINNIDVVVVNLYPFSEVVTSNPNDIDLCIENIDIGGVSLLRAGSKNYSDVVVLSDPNQYEKFMNNNHNNKELALDAFKVTSTYDSLISNWLSDGKYITQNYEVLNNLKYGCNPYQDNATILKNINNNFPFEILNGSPGYINILDAINSWALVFELKVSLTLQAAASFKHTSPAGVAIYRDLSLEEKEHFNMSDDLSNIAQTYIRARDCDPKSSFGDFIAVNSNVDVSLAKVIKPLVTDGIIAPSYDDEAFEILKQKKQGNFIILQGNQHILEHNVEYRQFKNCVLSQSSNIRIIDSSDLNNIVTETKFLNNTQINDMNMALITLKYTQSNSVGYAYNGQMIGIGAGQQSRIDCVRLARMKAETWFLRTHPIISSLKFVENIKKQEKINAIISYIEDDFTPVEYNRWLSNFIETPPAFTYEEKRNYLDNVTNVVLASDAFFPFRDSIDKASKIGVTCVVQPGGSIADENVIEACNEYNMVMVNTNIRLFHH